MRPHEILTEAKRYVNGWEFAELSSITWTPNFKSGALWYPPHNEQQARIEVGWEQDSDVLWHEVFHSVFHNSPLKKTNGWWGEAFCNVFSEVSRQSFYKSSVDDSDKEKALSDEHWRRYIVPCVLILQHVGFDALRFFIFWRDINDAACFNPKPFSLSSFFKYDPETGIFS